MVDVVRFPGTVEWAGENPGIFLKSDPNGPFTILASLFRVVLSPHGRGHALVLVQIRPMSSCGHRPIVFDRSNEKPLARWLVARISSSKYQRAFQGNAGLRSLVYRKLDSVESGGDPGNIYSESLKAGDLNVTLTWSGLGVPFCFAYPPELSATGAHHMPSLFIGCLDASILVNGKASAGLADSARSGGPENHQRDVLAFSRDVDQGGVTRLPRRQRRPHASSRVQFRTAE